MDSTNIAIIVGSVAVLYFFWPRGGATPAAVGAEITTTAQQQQQQQQQPQTAATAAAAPVTAATATAAQRAARDRAALPTRADDLAGFVSAVSAARAAATTTSPAPGAPPLHRMSRWPILLHTRSGFDAVPLALLRGITQAYPSLVIVHQVHSAADAAGDIARIRAHVDTGAFPRHRLVVCETDKGVESIARQFEPVMLVSDSRALCVFMAAFVTYCVHVAGPAYASTDAPLVGAIATEAVAASAGARAPAVSPTATKLHVVASAAYVLPVPVAAPA